MTKREIVAMALVSAVFIAICIALYVAADGITPKDVLLSSIPSWLQGLGTVAAAYVGWLAYRNWTRQEIAKGRAADAKAILLQTHAVVKRIRALRSVHGSYSTPVKVEHVKRGMNPKRLELARASNVAASTLNDSVEMARELFDGHLSSCLQRILELENSVTAAVGYMESLLQDAEGSLNDNHWQEEAERELKLLGFKRLTRDGKTRDRSDECDTQLVILVKQVSDTLRPHIHYGESPPTEARR